MNHRRVNARRYPGCLSGAYRPTATFPFPFPFPFALPFLSPCMPPSAFANIFSISACISFRFVFNVLTSSNFRCALASSTNASNSASCSSRGCSACATAESGSMSGPSSSSAVAEEAAVEVEPFVFDLGVGRDLQRRY